jgi:hypothetical protein
VHILFDSALDCELKNSIWFPKADLGSGVLNNMERRVKIKPP